MLSAATDSPLRDRVLFIEGLPRSGTSWLVSLVASHPDIAGTASETHLFNMGLDRVFDNHENPVYGTYLAAYVSSEQLAGLAREFCDGVFLAMREKTKPAAAFVVEKTPLFSRRAGDILDRKLRCYPDAWYLHVTRDPAAVIRSLAKAPFANWSDEEVIARIRQSDAALRERLGSHPRYREVGYDALRADPVEETSAIFDWLGLESGEPVRQRMRALSKERFAQFEPPDDASRAPGRGWRARLRRLARPLSRRPPASDPATMLIEAIRDQEVEKLHEVTSDALRFELRTGSGDVLADGDGARRALMQAGEALFRKAYVYFDWRPAAGGQIQSFMAHGVTSETERVDVAFHMACEGGGVTRVTMISAGDLAGRPMRDLEGDS